MFFYDSLGASFARRCLTSALTGSLLLLLTLFFSGCSSDEDKVNAPPANSQSASSSTPASTSLKPVGGGTITANPNPVPAGTGNGTSKISWNVDNPSGGKVEVYVSENGKAENKFAEATKGSQDAPWINAIATYEFRLYQGTGADRKLLANVTVTRNK